MSERGSGVKKCLLDEDYNWSRKKTYGVSNKVHHEGMESIGSSTIMKTIQEVAVDKQLKITP